MQVLELNSMDDLIEQVGWLCEVGLDAPQLLFVSDVEGVFLLLAARNARVLVVVRFWEKSFKKKGTY